jgi:hypothetical protein
MLGSTVSCMQYEYETRLIRVGLMSQQGLPVWHPVQAINKGWRSSALLSDRHSFSAICLHSMLMESTPLQNSGTKAKPDIQLQHLMCLLVSETHGL